MPVEVRPRTRRVISVHNEPSAIRFHIPNVHPGEYYIPSVEEPEEAFEALCRMAIPIIGKRPSDFPTVQYAFLHQMNGTKYVEIEVFEARTFMQTPAKQEVDEYGQKMKPDVQRVGLPVLPEELVNEIERTYGKMGIIAIQGETPTEPEIKKARDANLAWKRGNIIDATKWERLLGPRQITDQHRRHAWELNKLGLLNPMPGWATMNPDASFEDIKNCPGCGTIIQPANLVKCLRCGAIFDWRKAIDLGIVAPDDVPPQRRAEAGLESSSSPVAQGEEKLLDAHPEA